MGAIHSAKGGSGSGPGLSIGWMCKPSRTLLRSLPPTLFEADCYTCVAFVVAGAAEAAVAAALGTPASRYELSEHELWACPEDPKQPRCVWPRPMDDRSQAFKCLTAGTPSCHDVTMALFG